MFINCPNCSALVATDLATNLPPEHCSGCGFGPLVDISKGPSGPRAAAADRPQEDPADAIPADTGMDTTAGPVVQAAPLAAGQALADAPDPEPPRPPTADPLPAEPALDQPAPARAGPRFLHRQQAAATARTDWREIAVVAGLATLLAAQLLLADRSRLAADAGWRPVLATLCGALRCSLPAWREPAAIAIEQRDVRPAPEQPGVLQVNALIRNDARWPQAWPRLTLTLSDIDGRALGVRAFKPAEYLTGPPREPTLASGDTAAIRLDIVEPSPHAVAFNFQFD